MAYLSLRNAALTTSSINVSSLNMNTAQFSTLTGSTITDRVTTASTIGFSTMAGSTIQATTPSYPNATTNVATTAYVSTAIGSSGAVTLSGTNTWTGANTFNNGVTLGATNSYLFNIGAFNIQQTTNIQTNFTIIGSSNQATNLYLPNTTSLAMYVIYATTTNPGPAGSGTYNSQWFGITYTTFWQTGYGNSTMSQAGNNISISIQGTDGRIYVSANGGSGSYPNSVVLFNRIF